MACDGDGLDAHGGELVDHVLARFLAPVDEVALVGLGDFVGEGGDEHVFELAAHLLEVGALYLVEHERGVHFVARDRHGARAEHAQHLVLRHRRLRHFARQHEVAPGGFLDIEEGVGHFSGQVLREFFHNLLVLTVFKALNF